MARFDRRTFIKVSGAVLASAAVLPACGDDVRELEPEPEPNDGAQPFALDVASIPHVLEAFPRGIQAGAMSSTSALLWSFARDDGPKTLFVWRESSRGRLLAHQSVHQPNDGFVKARVEGLGPGRYAFAFLEGDADSFPHRSAIGSFRTAFAENDLRPLTICGLTCTSLRNAPFRALHLTAAERPDVICHLGDMSYNDGARTLEEYRARWAMTLEEPGYHAAYASAGFYATWDDHEVDNDYDPERMVIEEPGKLEAAKDAFFETLAVERGANGELWRSHRWGETAEFFVVDSRSERKPSTRDTDYAEYLSRAQMDWLKDAIVKSRAKWKIVLNSVPMTNLPEIWNLIAFDRWASYQTQRDELVDHLVANDVQDVIFLSGDFHCGFIGRLNRTGPARTYWEIAVGPSANGPNPLAVYAETGDFDVEEIFPADQFPYYSATTMATTTIVLDPFASTIHVKYVDARPATEGTVLFDADLT